jgi:2-(1,2-epoxy-1,2-dihydrophenyl)acetyl-CoA isomerase
MAEELEISDEGSVRWIMLDRPKAKNGLTDQINQRIITALGEAEEKRAIRAVVLTGRGGTFCSGADLRSAPPGGLDEIEHHLRTYFQGLIRAIRKVPKPVIGLIDGVAAGFGCDLALACDLRIGTERTRLGEVFVKRGLMPDGGGTFMLPRLIGLGRALEMMLTGELVGAEEALRMGLLNRIVPSAEAESHTRTFAQQLAAGPPLVHARVKRAVYGSLAGTLDEALEVEAQGQLELTRSQDFLEGVSAFFQKRPPEFKGE